MQCNSTVTCCIGSCVADKCNDGLFKNNRDRSGAPPDISQLIHSEMETRNKIDVSDHPNINLIASLDECGESMQKRRRTKRIVGGVPYELGKYPWAVALQTTDIAKGKTTFHCGGSLISKRFVITAGNFLLA